MDEFVALYYGRAANKVRAYLSLIEETARRSGIHQHCFGSAASYGIDAAVARKALSLLEEGMTAAKNDEVKRRVEKVTIGPRTVLIEPFARWVRNHQHEIAPGTQVTAPPEVCSGIKTELREVFRLYDRHGVDHFAEWVSIPRVKATLPAMLFAGG
jgi:hypothetical protein